MKLYIFCLFFYVSVVCAISTDVSYITKTSIPTSYLLEIVVLTPGGSPSNCVPAIPSMSVCNGMVTVTKTLSNFCPPCTTSSTRSSTFTKTVTLTPYSASSVPSSTSNSYTLPKTSEMYPNNSNDRSCSATVTISETKTISAAGSSPIRPENLSSSAMPTNPSSSATPTNSLPSIKPTNSLSSMKPTNPTSPVTSSDLPVNSTASPQLSTVTQTVTQRILSLQNIRLVRRYPDE
ncbi:hypothetical protein MDAP_002784 [Mitosporidium daphniae]|uniref:Uncharacterized protein n=1 Tax=Mitosporidium daphniae TaxID=1485682 RepID=A0A098VT54_9MICR|nr:uncharacterized protein DI09_1p150 [Mitosporidium daphniae]KGG52165.1 hypothetical protein DI09_1p150 [Mitosporidium daphniae]|eukprot:XP_013238592.1 uncharacterized protein DI09_1p150 [Mitosporidium daphniae]